MLSAMSVRLCSDSSGIRNQDDHAVRLTTAWDGAQDKEATPRFNMANNKRSGLHMAIVCRMLKPEPSFFSKSDSQVRLLSTCILMWSD